MLSFIIIYIFALISYTIESINIPSSCVGLEDGTYLIKLLDDKPILSVECSNEYIIINPSSDPNWSLYFTSWIKYHYGVIGPDRNDFVNWQQWFIPSKLNDQFLISLDCNQCDQYQSFQKHGIDSTFYLSALAFGCFNPTRGWPSCDFEYDTYQCRLCHWNDEQSQIIWTPRQFTTITEADNMGELTGICDFEIRKSTDKVYQSYHECTTYIPTDYNNFKPSIGIDNRNCVCYKPIQLQQQQLTITVTDEEYQEAITLLQSFRDQQQKQEILQQDTIIHLKQSDFDKGTYRILKSGTYIIDEDIVFNFNPPSDDDDPLSDGMFSYILLRICGLFTFLTHKLYVYIYIYRCLVAK